MNKSTNSIMYDIWCHKQKKDQKKEEINQLKEEVEEGKFYIRFLVMFTLLLIITAFFI